MHERYSYYRNIAYISVIFGGYVLIWYSRGMRHIATKGEVVKILDFTHFSRVFKFNKTSEIGRKKEIFHEIKVSVVMELV